LGKTVVVNTSGMGPLDLKPQGALLYKILEVQIISCGLCRMESDAGDAEDLNTQKTLINICFDMRFF